MKNEATHEYKKPLPFVCFRCDKVIEPEEKMFCVLAELSSPTDDGLIGEIDAHSITQLCFGCALVMLAETAIKHDFVMPSGHVEAA